MKRIIGLFLVFCICLGTVYIPASAASEEDLVAYWSFDTIAEDSSGSYIRDLSGNNIDLKLNTTAYKQVNGFRGKAVDITLDMGIFDSTATDADKTAGYMGNTSEILNSELNGASQITVTGYIKKKSETKPIANVPVLYYKPFTGVALAMYPKTNSLLFQLRSSSTDGLSGITATNFKYATKGTDETKVGWAQFAVVVDYAAKSARIYIDGEQVAEDTNLANFKSDTFSASGEGTFNIGSRSDILDEVKIYRRGLSAEEIKKSMPSVVEYDFEDACNGTLNDLACGQVNGTVGTAEAVEGVRGKTVQLSTPVTLPVSGFASTLYGAKSVSVAFWLKMPTIAEDSADPLEGVSLIKGHTTSDIEFMNVKLNSRYSIGVTARTAQGESLTGWSAEHGIANVDTSWHHITMILDYAGKSVKIYVDGKEKVGSGSDKDKTFLRNDFLACAPNLSSKNDTIGSDKVLMDNVKIYRRSLTEDEIAELAMDMPETKVTFTPDADGKKLSADVTLANQTAAEKSGKTVIMAKYTKDGSRLISATSAATEALAANGGRYTAPLSIDGGENVSDCLYKVFVWDSFEKLTPIADSVSYGE